FAPASIATPTGLPSWIATPTRRSAPGASGTKCSEPLTVPPLSWGASPRSIPLAGSTVHVARTSPGGLTGRYAARFSPVASSSIIGASPATSKIAVAGRCPSSCTPAITRPHSPSTSIASKTSSPAPPCSSEINRPGQPASQAVGQRSGSAESSSSASRAASSVLKRESAPRAASRRNTCSSESERFTSTLLPSCSTGSCRRPFLAAQLGERDALVEPRLRGQAEHALADRVAQDLFRAARGLEPGQERDHVRPLAVLGERVGAEHVG